MKKPISLRPRSLNQRLSWFLILPVAVMLIVIGIAGFLHARNLLLSEWREASLLKLQRAAHMVDMKLERTKDWIDRFSQSAAVEPAPALQLVMVAELRGQEGVADVILKWDNDEPAAEQGAHARMHGRGALGADERLTAMVPGRHQLMRRFHRASLKELTLPRYDEVIDHETVSLISELTDETERNVGRLEVKLDFGFLIQNLIEAGWWQSNKAFLVDAEGNILACTSKERRGRLGDDGDPVEVMALAAIGVQPYGTLLGGGHPPKEVAGFYKLQQAPWTLIMIAPGDEILKPIVRFRNYYFVLLAAAVLVILLLIRLVTMPTVNAIREISSAARKIAKGRFSPALPVKSRDEVGELTRSFNTMQSQLQERLKMKASINLAKEVQQSLLQKKMPKIAGFDIAARSIYCDETGGDFYDIIEWTGSKKDIFGVAVGDVSGHGIPSALLMASARAFLRSQSGQAGSAAQIVTQVNQLVAQDVEDTGQFLTLFYLEISRASGALKWVRAGHDPALFFDPYSNRADELKGDGIALGLDGTFRYKESSFPNFSSGQILLIGTDGLWEAQNPSGEMFGKERLFKVLQAHSQAAAEGIADDIIAALKEFRGDAKQEDDVTLVVLKSIG